mmetsp:Transcript_682/g.1838  ORF Transcript_682/g.1838 Transcript_682/m.1838 type:complete len:290 (-) Transcript_682:463-1332(-)
MDRARGLALQELCVVLLVRRQATRHVARPVALGQVPRDALRPRAALGDFELSTLRRGPRGALRRPRRRDQRPPALPDPAPQGLGEERPERALRDRRHGPRLGPSHLVPSTRRQVLRAVGDRLGHREALRRPRGQDRPPRPAAPRTLLARRTPIQSRRPPSPRPPRRSPHGARRRRRRRRRQDSQGRQEHRRRARRPPGDGRRRLRQKRTSQARPRSPRLAPPRPSRSPRLCLEHRRVHGRRRLHRHQGRPGHHRRVLHPRPPLPPLLLPPRPGGRQRQVRHQAPPLRQL